MFVSVILPESTYAFVAASCANVGSCTPVSLLLFTVIFSPSASPDPSSAAGATIFVPTLRFFEVGSIVII